MTQYSLTIPEEDDEMAKSALLLLLLDVIVSLLPLTMNFGIVADKPRTNISQQITLFLYHSVLPFLLLKHYTSVESI